MFSLSACTLVVKCPPNTPKVEKSSSAHTDKWDGGVSRGHGALSPEHLTKILARALCKQLPKEESKTERIRITVLNSAAHTSVVGYHRRAHTREHCTQLLSRVVLYRSSSTHNARIHRQTTSLPLRTDTFTWLWKRIGPLLITAPPLISRVAPAASCQPAYNPGRARPASPGTSGRAA